MLVVELCWSTVHLKGYPGDVGDSHEMQTRKTHHLDQFLRHPSTFAALIAERSEGIVTYIPELAICRNSILLCDQVAIATSAMNALSMCSAFTICGQDVKSLD